MIFGVDSRKIRKKYLNRKVTKIVVRVDGAGRTYNPLAGERWPVYKVKIRENERTDGRPSVFLDVYREDMYFRFYDTIAKNHAIRIARRLKSKGIKVEVLGPKYKVRDKLEIK